MGRDEKLFEQFPPVTTKEWMERINADLRGADFSKKLVWKTSEGFDVMPFYRQEDLNRLKHTDCVPGEYPYIRGNNKGGNTWRIRQDIGVTDYGKSNKKAREIFLRGIDSPGFVFSDPESITAENLGILLEGIHPEAVEFNFLTNGKAKELALSLIEWVRKSGFNPSKIRGAIEADPLGRLIVNGTLCIPVEKGLDYLAAVVTSLSVLPQFRAIHIKASNFGNSGADIVRELAMGLSMGTEYVVQLTDRGIDTAMAFSKIRFSFGIGADYFPEIAKLRAARLLWSAIADRFLPGNREAARMEIHSVTGRWNKTLFDPYINILRAQTEAMSAILGGTDSLTVEPFDIVFRDPSEFSERIARNQQIILKEESYFDRVSDPGAGSYYIENLTNLIAGSAWKLFLEIEDNGGFLESVKKGFIQEKVKESALKREAEVSVRKRTFVGTNRFPDQSEQSAPEKDMKRVFNHKQYENELIVEPLRQFRGTEKFEQLRLNVEKAERKPVVFLFTIGNHSLRKARALFASDFFGCAGYRIIDTPGFETPEDGIKEVHRLKPDIVVICSSDDEYSRYVPGIFDSLKETTLLVVAGNPPCSEMLRSIGVEFFISSRSDLYQVLESFNRNLGIV
jgi:methylmalonyl-CoA mutase